MLRLKESKTMAHINRRPTLKTIITALRRRVAQSDLAAMCDLGMWLQKGFQSRKGRRVLRRDPAYYSAFSLALRVPFGFAFRVP
jgi:hypothetical protein